MKKKKRKRKRNKVCKIDMKSGYKIWKWAYFIFNLVALYRAFGHQSKIPCLHRNTQGRKLELRAEELIYVLWYTFDWRERLREGWE